MATPRVTITIPHAADVVLRRMTTVDRLGQPFEFQLDLKSKSSTLAYEDFLGQSATVHVELPLGGTRHFNGIITSFRQTTVDGAWHEFRAVLRPWFWLLTRTSDCRIFQNLDVVGIFKAVCSDLGFSDYELSLTGTYSPREYCVQYRESAFQFLSRLFEEEGIYYYFKHDDAKHNLVLADGTSGHSAFASYGELPFAPEKLIDESVNSWNVSLELQSGSYVLTDYDFQKPQADLKAQLNAQYEHPHSTFEVYDYPGRYIDSDTGNAFVRTRIEESEAQFKVVNATTDARGVAAGCLLTLTDHPREDQNADYLIVAATHHFINPDVEGTADHSCEFLLIPKAQTFRAPRVTPKPLIAGIQTAVVTGKAGEEIFTDSYGRVKVQFHWDRLGKNDENSSCFIRVAQTWAGKRWGAQFLPRLGQEVVVEFLEGDPDRPLITGSVYNADQPVPYALPDNMTQSGVKTHSTKTGDDKTFNELRFEDKKESEEVYFHAEKDFNRVVENNDTLTVGLEKKDAGDQTIQIHNNRTVTLDEGNDTLQVKKGKRDVKIDEGDHLLTVGKGNREATISTGNDTLTISKGNREVKIDAGNHTVTVTQGNQTIKITAGSMSTEAGQAIELKVGGNSIKIDTSGITIKGTMVSIEGMAKTDIKAPMTTVNGDGMLTLKGGLLQIN